MRILFVCTGNTCRSPMAMAVARQMYPHWEIQSAGLAAFGDPISRNAQIALEYEGFSLHGHRSKTVDESLIQWADIVLTMTGAQKDALKREYPLAQILTLQEAANGSGGDIADPFGQDVHRYRETLRELQKTIKELKKWER